jgi:site-specific DNA-cytosine methylase
VFQVEKEPFCLKVLKKNFPKTKRYEDIYEFKGEKTGVYRGAIDVVSGGFP